MQTPWKASTNPRSSQNNQAEEAKAIKERSIHYKPTRKILLPLWLTIIKCLIPPHRKNSVQHFLPPSHYLICSQHILGWNIYTEKQCKSQFHPSRSLMQSLSVFLAKQTVKQQFVLKQFVIVKQFWLAQSWSMWKSTLPFQSYIPETAQEHSPLIL